MKGALSGVGKDTLSKLAEEESYPLAKNLCMVGEESPTESGLAIEICCLESLHLLKGIKLSEQL